MISFMKKFSLLGLSAAMLTASILPSQAMPMISAPAAPAPSGDVVQVQYWRHYGGPGHWRGGGYYRPGPGYARPGWYGGYRGYRYERPGYRYHNGFWFPLAAFGAGAIIGGAIASEPRYVAPPRSAGLNPRHYEYCAARYRSYDAYSNTFQPYNGPRQQCYSPYY